MGAGCLSPKPRIGQIYIDCINSIYQEVKTYQKISEYKIYDNLKDKIMKKGLLKKLMDYLQCHRSMISEALLHNYRIMVQCYQIINTGKNINCKLTSLIITDYIINVVLKKTNTSQRSFAFNLVDKQSYSTYQSSQIKKQGSLQNATILKKQLVIFNYNQENQKQNQDPQTGYRQSITTQQSFEQLLKQIKNIKFHNIYFNMLKELVQIQQIFQFAVESILIYSSINNVKSNLQQPIIEIVKFLLQNIKKRNHLFECLKCYYILLQKLKDSNIQKQIQNIGFFFQLWEESFNYFQQKLLEQRQIDQIIKSKIIIQKIISKFISLSVGTNSLNQIYYIILNIYDSKKFTNMQHFQDLLVSTTKNEDLKQKFFRGLFCQSLCYFSVCKLQQQICLYNWSKLSINKPIDHYVSKYHNIFNNDVKKQVVNTLGRWLKSLLFVDINKIIRYNMCLFLYSFDFNILCSKDSQFSQKVVQQLIQMCLHANSNQKIMIINALFQQLKQVRKSTYHKMLDLNVIESLLQSKIENQLVSKKNIISDIQNVAFHFCPCEFSNQFKVNSKILQLFKKIIKQYGLSSSIIQIDQVSYFLYSIYQFVANNTYSLAQFWDILKDIQSIFQQIEQQNGELILLAFGQRILKAQKIDLDNVNLIKITQFLCILIVQILNNPKLANRTKFRKTTNKIYMLIAKINQFKQKALNLTKQQIQTQKLKIQAQIYSQQAYFDEVWLPDKQQFSISNEEKLYQNASIVFRDMFQRGVSVMNFKFKTSGDQFFGQSSKNNHNNCFSRVHSVVQIQNIEDQDKSIKDIMDMINI